MSSNSKDLFDIKKQLTFYGAYHHNPINITIHEIFVPIILWSLQVLASTIPMPSFIPTFHVVFNDWFEFELNWSAIHALVYVSYYFMLEPVAAAAYVPQLTLSLLTATAYAHNNPDGIRIAGIIHAAAWIAQFIGHYGPEGRSPALLDNLVGALILGPFFVHLELLFFVGYRPTLRKELKNSIGAEIVRIRKLEAEQKRVAEAKKEKL